MNNLENINTTIYAAAYITGTKDNPSLKGLIQLIPWNTGSIVKLEITGLTSTQKNNFFGFHIHENGVCEKFENFESAGGHFNPNKDLHPNHIGDLPMIYSNNGYAFMVYYTDRFTPKDVIGKTIIIHDMPDDLKTQPSGNSGKRIACGVIEIIFYPYIPTLYSF